MTTSGDVVATVREFKALYKEEYTAVHAFCARRVGASEAADAVAEVFTIAWRRLEELPVDTARPWLFGVARNTVLNTWRSERRRSRLTGKLRSIRRPAPLGPDSELLRAEEAHTVLRALGTLRAADQEILILSTWDELTGPEIAELLGLSTAAVDQRIHRARKRLAAALEASSGDRAVARSLAHEGGGS